jgi:hypothetical protein
MQENKTRKKTEENEDSRCFRAMSVRYFYRMNETEDILAKKRKLDYALAVAGNLDSWVPACGGTEAPFTVREKRFLYCYNPRQDRHAYLDLTSDMIMEDEDYFAFIS